MQIARKVEWGRGGKKWGREEGQKRNIPNGGFLVSCSSGRSSSIRFVTYLVAEVWVRHLGLILAIRVVDGQDNVRTQQEHANVSYGNKEIKR